MKKEGLLFLFIIILSFGFVSAGSYFSEGYFDGGYTAGNNCHRIVEWRDITFVRGVFHVPIIIDGDHPCIDDYIGQNVFPGYYGYSFELSDYDKDLWATSYDLFMRRPSLNSSQLQAYRDEWISVLNANNIPLPSKYNVFDCDDTNPSITNQCFSNICVDADKDGYFAVSSTCFNGNDCDDTNPNFPRLDSSCCKGLSPLELLKVRYYWKSNSQLGIVFSSTGGCSICEQNQNQLFIPSGDSSFEKECCQNKPTGTNVICEEGYPRRYEDFFFKDKGCEFCDTSANKIIYFSNPNNPDKVSLINKPVGTDIEICQKESIGSFCCPINENQKLNIFQKQYNQFCAKCYIWENSFVTSSKFRGFNFPFCKEGDLCRICKDNRVLSIDTNQPDNKNLCLRKLYDDCSIKNQVCVEHREGIFSNINAKCEDCPTSLNFVTSKTMFSVNDFTKILYSSVFDLPGLSHPNEFPIITTQNTFSSYNTLDEVFSKVQEICSKCPDNSINLILTNHGFPGKIIFRFGEYEDFIDSSKNRDFMALTIENIKRLDNFDLSCVKSMIFNSCNVGRGVKGMTFLNAVSGLLAKQNGGNGAATGANTFSVKLPYSQEMGPLPIIGKMRLSLNGKEVEGELNNFLFAFSNPITQDRVSYLIAKNNQKLQLKTIFYQPVEGVFPNMPDYVYQTEVYYGNPGEVYVGFKNNLSDVLIAMNDSSMICDFEIEDSINFSVSSTNLNISLDNFEIKVPSENLVSGKNVSIRINKLRVDCSNFNLNFPETKYIDKSLFGNVSALHSEGLISEDYFLKIKELYDNHWLCLSDEDCSGNCTIEKPFCYDRCVDHTCKLFEIEQSCDAIDENNDSVPDEVCDKDQDGYYDSNLICNGSFVSNVTNVMINFSQKNELVLKAGWNLVYVPTEKQISIEELREKYPGQVAKQCIVFHAWGYNSGNNSYTKVFSIGNAQSYWIYSLNNCSFPLLDYKPINKTILNLNYGWNSVPAFDLDMINKYKSFGLVGSFWIADLTGTLIPSTTLTQLSNPIQSAFIFWDGKKQISCSNKDCDDLNPEIGVC